MAKHYSFGGINGHKMIIIIRNGSYVIQNKAFRGIRSLGNVITYKFTNIEIDRYPSEPAAN